MNAQFVCGTFPATEGMQVYFQVVDITEFEIVPSYAQSLCIFDVSNAHDGTILSLNLKDGRA